MFGHSPSDDCFDTFRHAAFVEGSHVRMHLFKIFCQCAVRVTPRYGAEFKHGLVRKWLSEPVIVHAGKFMEFFPRNHEGSQIGSVNGEKDHGE